MSSPRKSAAPSLRSPARKRRKARPACGHEVDLEPETPKIRQQKRQALRRAGFRAALWLIVGFCLLALGVTTWRQTLHHNPRFRLQEVTVYTEGGLTPQRLVKAMDLVEGMDTLWLNLRAVAEKAERLPQVKSASATRDYHGRMEVTVVQRHPVAWLECRRLGLMPMRSGFGCLLDEEGVAMPCEVILRDYTRLPAIVFEDLSQVHPGVPVKDFQVVAALELRAQLEKRMESGMAELVRIEVPVKYALVASFTDGMEVTFSPHGLEDQLRRFDRVMIEAHQNGWKIATLNLIPRENVPVTFRQTPKMAAVTEHR